jgi:outer membrane biosynthesis protein TonB
MRILVLTFVLALAACAKKKEDAGQPPATGSATAEVKPATKPEEAPAPAPVDEKPTPTETEKPTPTETATEKPAPTEKAPTEAKPTEKQAAGPSREAAIKHLREVLAVLEAKDYGKAVAYFAFPANERPRSPEAAFGKLIELKEISAKGIDVLAAKGKYGKLAEVLGPEKAAHFADKFKVAVDECWGFAVDGAQANATVGFHWDGSVLRLIRLNNVGKLE